MHPHELVVELHQPLVRLRRRPQHGLGLRGGRRGGPREDTVRLQVLLALVFVSFVCVLLVLALRLL